MAFAFAALLPSCISARQPAPGMALVDVYPKGQERERLSGIRLASVNGAKHSRTWAELEPGRNHIEVSFKWPQGGKQLVEFDFNAHKDAVYYVHFSRYPPCHTADGGSWDDALNASEGFPPVLLVAGLGSLAERGRMSLEQKSKGAVHVDVILVSPRTSEGVVEFVRAYPDGRTVSR